MLRTEGIAEQFRLRTKTGAEADEGYRGLADEFPCQLSAPPKRPQEDAPLGAPCARREMRRRQSSARICAENVHAELRQWRPLRHCTGRRGDYAETHRAIASLAPDRSARRATRRRPSTELALARQAAR
ncbi:hypothetical protein ACFWOL_26305 [Streptomyces sp. NPDC058442]|uniref:hypothetical protein n=1 Tax=Streptomyces sp. NPDC058442 TaxID=3346503 RepID=UPI0036612698